MKRTEWLLIALSLLVAVYFTLNWAIEGAVHYYKEIPVPDLVGKPLMEVLDVLNQNNLGLRKEGFEFNDKIPAGTVIRQQPEPGSTVREGKMIRVTLSQGGEMVLLPDLVGQSLRSAEIAIRNNFLVLGEVTERFSAQYDKEIVISQEPQAREFVKKNSLIHLVVSNGVPADGSLLMPEFKGKNWTDVESWAKDAEVQAVMNEDFSSNQPSGIVLGQSILPDTALEKGVTVEFLVASIRSGGDFPGNAQKIFKFHFEVPQGSSAKDFSFVLVDSLGSREMWRGKLEPGSKHDIPISKGASPSARIRIFVNGILTEERMLQP